MKRPFTLMEVCISLGLAAIPISYLFNNLLITLSLSHKTNALVKAASESHACYTRLLHVLSHAHDLTVEGDTATFFFENGLDPTLAFSGDRKATLTAGRHLTLTIESALGTQEEPLLQTPCSFEHHPSHGMLTLHTEQRDYVFFLPHL